MQGQEMSNPNTNLKLHLGLVAFALLAMYLGGWFVAVPLLAWVAARWVIMLVSALKRRTAEQALADWQGRYFAFDDRQIRILAEDDALWVVAEDVFKALDRPSDAKSRQRVALRLDGARFCQPAAIGRDCFSRAGVIDYLGGLAGETPMKMRRWFEREVFPSFDRQREREARSVGG